MVVVTGGSTGAATGSELSQLVARFAVEQPDDARRTGAQAIAAMGDALLRLPLAPEHARRTAHELRKRAERLATAPPLDYAGQLKDALSLVVRSLVRAAAPPAERRLLDEARGRGGCDPRRSSVGAATSGSAGCATAGDRRDRR